MKDCVVLIVPTGIGAEIGGHAGDANPVARLLARTCRRLLTHPNVVNASDVNEMTENTLYVEGSMLDSFLEGKIGLTEVNSNKILLAVNSPVRARPVNAASTARVTLGVEVSIMPLRTPLIMRGRIEDRKATGDVEGWRELVEQAREHDFDALAVSTPIDVGKGTALRYYKEGGVNPWGGVEAKASRLIAEAIGKPVAHAPVEWSTIENNPELFLFDDVVDPRIAPEEVSTAYTHCILKGLHKAPQIGNDIMVDDILCMVSPINCVGRPHRACLERGVPIIAVEENKTVLNDEMPGEFIIAKSYSEAAGLILGMMGGISRESLSRPIQKTNFV